MQRHISNVSTGQQPKGVVAPNLLVTGVKGITVAGIVLVVGHITAHSDAHAPKGITALNAVDLFGRIRIHAANVNVLRPETNTLAPLTFEPPLETKIRLQTLLVVAFPPPLVGRADNVKRRRLVPEIGLRERHRVLADYRTGLERNSQRLPGAPERFHLDEISEALRRVRNVEIPLLEDQMTYHAAVAAHTDAGVPHPRHSLPNIHASIQPVRIAGDRHRHDDRLLG